MRKNLSAIGGSRRQFIASGSALILAGFSGSTVHARGGGGDVVRDRQERARGNARRGITQRQFLNLSRSELFRNSKAQGVFIDGFSQEMSPNMFEMAVANLARTRALVKHLQTIPHIPKRQAVLNRELQLARQELEDFWGLASQKQKRKTYHEAVKAWTGNPREGALDFRYTG